MMRYAFIILVVFSLIVPFAVANATPQENYNYTPRIGSTLEYSGVLSVVGPSDRGLTNQTLEMSLNVTITSYVEDGFEAYASVQYRGIYSLYVNGSLQGSVPVTENKDLMGYTFIGLVDEDYMLFLAANVSMIPIGLRIASVELSPMNFSARLIDYQGEKALKVLFTMTDDEDQMTMTGELIFLLRYGVYAYEDIYVTSLSEGMFMHAIYKLEDAYDIEPIIGGIDYPSERLGLAATREVTNGTDTATISVEINDVASVGGAIFIDFTSQISGYTPITITRSSTLGNTPTKDLPRVIFGFIVYPPLLEEIASEENATLVNVTISGETYEAYKFSDNDTTIVVLKDLGLVAQITSPNGTITLTELSLASSSGGENEGGNENNQSSSSLSAQQTMIIIVAVIAILLALIALLLKRG